MLLKRIQMLQLLAQIIVLFGCYLVRHSGRLEVVLEAGAALRAAVVHRQGLARVVSRNRIANALEVRASLCALEAFVFRARRLPSM